MLGVVSFVTVVAVGLVCQRQTQRGDVASPSGGEWEPYGQPSRPVRIVAACLDLATIHANEHETRDADAGAHLSQGDCELRPADAVGVCANPSADGGCGGFAECNLCWHACVHHWRHVFVHQENETGFRDVVVRLLVGDVLIMVFSRHVEGTSRVRRLTGSRTCIGVCARVNCGLISAGGTTALMQSGARAFFNLTPSFPSECRR